MLSAKDPSSNWYNLTFSRFFPPFRQVFDQTSLLKFILETVSKTNMVDYKHDIRERLAMDKVHPDELAQGRANVLATLKELQAEVAPLMKCMEELKNPDSTKDSKSVIHALQQTLDVSRQQRRPTRTRLQSVSFCFSTTLS